LIGAVIDVVILAYYAMHRFQLSRFHQDKALDVLRENMFAGERIEKKKFPKYYVLKYGINNLYKYNLDGGNRLIYTLVADESGVAVVVLEVLSHKEYERRFGYD